MWRGSAITAIIASTRSCESSSTGQGTDNNSKQAVLETCRVCLLQDSKFMCITSTLSRAVMQASDCLLLSTT